MLRKFLNRKRKRGKNDILLPAVIEERINLSVNLESLLETCSDYYDWKICSGLEATHFI